MFAFVVVSTALWFAPSSNADVVVGAGASVPRLGPGVSATGVVGSTSAGFIGGVAGGLITLAEGSVLPLKVTERGR